MEAFHARIIGYDIPAKYATLMAMQLLRIYSVPPLDLNAVI
jgi:hypothetical protein